MHSRWHFKVETGTYSMPSIPIFHTFSFKLIIICSYNYFTNSRQSQKDIDTQI